MIFSTYKFIFAFFPIVLTGYVLLALLNREKLSRVWLVMASLYFYAQGSRAFFPLFVFTILFNYGAGKAMFYFIKQNKKSLKVLFFILGLGENIGLLIYFKYTNFFIDSVNSFMGLDIPFMDLILPIGISFFTFQLIGYQVDIYRQEARDYSFLDYCVFITFFPQLIVGPIVHHKAIVTQLEDPARKPLSMENIQKGIYMFAIGCSKKILIADPLIHFAKAFYSTLEKTSVVESWLGVLSYTFAYYFDFSAYGDMAIGLGLFFNIVLPFNFDSPYKARNMADFWRRWNMTLSQFLNDYIFKGVYKFGDRAPKLYVALMMTFLVSGFWHGAGWNFILWGLVNGVMVSMVYMMTLNRKQLPGALAWTLTFAGVILARVIFDSSSLTQMILVYKSMLDIRPLFQDPSGFLSESLQYIRQNAYMVIVLLISIILTFFTKNSKQRLEQFEPKWQYAVFAGILITVALFRMTEVSDFLYFRF